MAAKLGGGGGGGKYSQPTDSDINVTPLVDVMLVLLIIFMVAAPLATVSIKLDLPPAIPPPPSAHPKPPTVISLQKSGAIYIGQNQTRVENIAGDVTAALHSPTPQQETVYIRSDKEVRYETFMSVLNALQDGGFYKVSLITESRS